MVLSILVWGVGALPFGYMFGFMFFDVVLLGKYSIQTKLLGLAVKPLKQHPLVVGWWIELKPININKQQLEQHQQKQQLFTIS